MLNVFLLCALLAGAPADSLVRGGSEDESLELREATVFSQPKESGPLRSMAASSSTVTASALMQHHVVSLKDFGALVPNVFMPAYGSRGTQAVYIRGIGSRVNAPAVGLYVDNIPQFEKSAYDLPFYDVGRVEVLRGPQSTLYGAGTMGGVIRVHTRSPFVYEGTDVRMTLAVGNWERRLSATHYHRLNDRVALSAGGFYEGSEGFFSREMGSNGHSKMDGENAGGVRLRALYRNGDGLRLDGNVSFDMTGGGAYAYYYKGVANGGAEPYPAEVGLISANLDGRYDRWVMKGGVNVELLRRTWKLNAVTGLQYLNDRMFMDQDFLQADIYQLEQRQRLATLSEEVTLNQSPCSWWEGLTGVSAYWQGGETKAPVRFNADGVTWLNGVINGQAGANLPAVQVGPNTMAFNFSDNIVGTHLGFDNGFHTPSLSVSTYHQSTFRLGALSVLMGMRLGYDQHSLSLDAGYAFQHRYELGGHLTMPNGVRDMVLVPAQTYDVRRRLEDAASAKELHYMPKLALKYELTRGNVYASVARGYRSGGYNIQNVSDLLQVQMMADMMSDVARVTLAVPQAQQMMPEAAKNMIMQLASRSVSDVAASCRYRPEYAWNYEVGTHLDFPAQHLSLDGSAFWSDIYDIQISRMSDGGLGRVTVNAGRSRSLGLEASMRYMPIRNLQLAASYGFTHATFRHYALSATQDFRGNYVPFMPRHNFSLDASYAIDLGRNCMVVGADVSGAGRIYWTEANSASQPFYLLLGARVGYRLERAEVTLWGRNLTNTAYDAFYFESMGRGFAQKGRPVQVGMDVRLRF